jgi:beta-lactamase class A
MGAGSSASVVQNLDDVFEHAGCTGALHVRRLSDGAEVALRERVPWLAASVIKVPIALEFYVQVAEGHLDPAHPVTLDPALRALGPTGISLAEDPVTMSLRDLCTAMLTISDNAATDAVLAAVGKDAVNERLRHLGCVQTVLVESIQESIDAMARELGFSDYATLLRAQAGELGHRAQARSTDQQRIDTSRVLDPARASRTTAQDMTRLLTAVWSDQAGPAEACGRLRRVMSQQLTRRLALAVPPGGSLAAKSGSLFGRVRNEVGMIGTPAGEFYAVAVLTRPSRPHVGVPAVDEAMVHAVKEAIETLGEG